MQKGVIIALVILALAVASGAYFYLNQPSNDGLVCAADVKQCSDGSYVSRDSGNNCEFAACPSANNSGNSDNETQPKTIEISISGFDFNPSTITVNVGDTVKWTNKDSMQHTVTSYTGNELDSPGFYRNGVYSHTFTATGEYPYYCIYHPSMEGKVIVK